MGGEGAGVEGAGAVALTFTRDGEVRSATFPLCAARGVPLPHFSRHTVTSLGPSGSLVTIGGGGAVFAFGVFFSPPLEYDTTAVIDAAKVALKLSNKEEITDNNFVIICAPKYCDIFRREMIEAGIFDLTRCVGTLENRNSSSSSVGGVRSKGIPITLLAAEAIQAGGKASSPLLFAALANGSAHLSQGALPLFSAPTGGDGGLISLARAAPALRALLHARGIGDARAIELSTPGGAVGGAPARASWLGDDLLILPSRSFRAFEWGDGGVAAATVLGTSLGAGRVGRAAEIDPGVTRASRLEMLCGRLPAPNSYELPQCAAVPVEEMTMTTATSNGVEKTLRMLMSSEARSKAYPLPPPDARIDAHGGGWVRIRDDRVIYTFDALRCMFSAGNAREKARMGALLAAGETVVDLYAGIGYFTLPLLVRARVGLLHAAEWNADAVACLRIALGATGGNGDAGSRAIVWPGDNARLAHEASVKGTANRVLLGLLPSSRRGWPIALAVLSPLGGILHVHENVRDGEAQVWATEELIPQLEQLAVSAGRTQWFFEINHIERVKSYAPRVAHYVFDVLVKVK